MNTYTLTEVELQELLRGQRELCYNAWLNMPQWDDDTPSDLRKRGLEHILGAPPPPLPSGAKKEDIQPVLRWVKAEERLPDERPGWSHSADVNILLRNVKDETHPLFVSTGAYRYLGVKKWCEYLYGDRLDNGDFEVVAWQPLPAAELSSSQNVPKSEELGNIRKQSLIELMEADQRDGIYGAEVRQFAIDYLCYIRLAELGYYDEDGNLVADKTAPIISSLKWAEESIETVSGAHLLNFLKKRIPHLLNSHKKVQVSDTTEDHSSNSADPQNTTKEPVIDNLRDKFLEDDISCTLTTDKANKVFEWFKPYLKSNLEPVIDWEGLKWAWLSEHAKGTFATDDPIEEFNWLKSNLSKYVK